MNQKTVLVILICFLTQSCNLGVSGTWKNDHIVQDKREQIKILNDKLFKTISNNDPASLKTIMSDSLLQKGDEIDKFINQISPAFKIGSYRVLDEYDVHSSTEGSPGNLPSGISGDNDYSINYTPFNKEIYISLLLTDGADNELMIFTEYGKYGTKWKLNILQVGQYSLFKKNAVYYYNQARGFLDKSYLIDAYLNIDLAEKLSRPANGIFIYQKDKEIQALFDSVRKDLDTKYVLPLTLNDIVTKPKIFRIYPQMADEGYCPMVQYLTSINLYDSTALKNENEQIKKEVKKLFTGIDQDKKYIFLQAFNELPDGKKEVEHFGYIDNLKK